MSEIINEAGSSLVLAKNTGLKDQKIEAAVKTYILAKEDVSFTLAEIKSLVNWNPNIINKGIVPFYEVEVLEANSVESIIANKRFRDVKTKDGIKGVTYTHELSAAAYAALNSYDGTQDYTRIFRITTENEILCEVQEDCTLKGEPITSFIVDNREDSTDETPATAKVYIKFDQYDISVIKPDFDATELEGIYDVVLTLGDAPTATSLKFNAKTWGTDVTNLVEANVVLKDASGAVQSPSFVSYDSDTGMYELTGTGFANDFTIDIDGVQLVGSIHVESTESLTVSGIS
ncbi:hypothetical protein Danklef4_10 [Polaribacter phage Danklef_4]|nr:hypothetical protein Danklef3_10 [Polaribacter phage Danklef_3]QQV90718.1 hypothetical protein Danklef4_10 [Polaribacter phage Danklef_4]QQV90795.1 hypothetical protein Danklef5_10 [Polaribacter phage Danklef_5]